MADLVFKKSTAREYFESLVITVILALFGTTFIVQAFKIPTPSMEDNLLVGDHLLVNKFVFGAPGSILDKLLPLKNIKRGDVIVFKYPKDLTKHYVKRAIGLPGDRIKIVDKQVFVNDVALKSRTRSTKRRPVPIRTASATFFLLSLTKADSLVASTRIPIGMRITPRMARSWCPPTTTSPWAITATIAPTAATGALFRAS